MDIKKLVIEWLEASNSYDTKKYLEKYSEDAVLNDSSLNLKFVGRDEIRDITIPTLLVTKHKQD